jgi:hypothetical protein
MLRNELIKLAHARPEFRSRLIPLIKEAGCEKLPEGPMRDNCEKKRDEAKDDDGGDDKKASMSLRSQVIRLAKEKPHLREKLLPLLK